LPVYDVHPAIVLPAGLEYGRNGHARKHAMPNEPLSEIESQRQKLRCNISDNQSFGVECQHYGRAKSRLHERNKNIGEQGADKFRESRFV